MGKTEFVYQIAHGLQAYAVDMGYEAVSAMVAIACDDSSYGTKILAREHNNFWRIPYDERWATEQVRVRGKDYASYNSPESGFFGYVQYLELNYPHLVKVTSSRDFLNEVTPDRTDALMYLIVTNNWERFDPVPYKRTALDYNQVVQDIIDGKHGTGLACKQKVVGLGYNFRRVEAMLKRRRQREQQ